MLTRPPILDDRGRTIRIARPDELPADAETQVRTLTAGLHAGRTWRFYAGLILPGLVVPLLSVLWVLRSSSHRLPSLLVILPTTLVFIFVWSLMGAWIMRGRRVNELREQCRIHSRCMQCGYSLVGLTPEADGCAVCPECGAAWRTGEVRSS